MKFKEWLADNQDDLSEGWARNALMGGALLGAGLGLGCSSKGSCPQGTSGPLVSKSVTSPNAKAFLSLSNQDKEKGTMMHPYRYVGGEDVPDWKVARQNYQTFGKTGLTPAHQKYYDQHFSQQ